MNSRPAISMGLACFLIVTITACAPQGTIPTQPAQSPDEYLSNALDWIETHSVKVNAEDWPTVREQALALAPNPQTTADTYPAILFAMKQLGDSATFFIPPAENKDVPGVTGFTAFYPEAVIVSINPGGPADQAGLQVGDIIEAINDAPPRQWQGTPFMDFYDDATLQMVVQRVGHDASITVTLEKASDELPIPPSGRLISMDKVNLGYIEIPSTRGDWTLYPTLAQQVIRKADQPKACGWIIDLRRTSGGDIWSYIAALGPILGEGEVGGFIYRDDMHEPWKYEDGKVYWGKQERDESLVEGAIYKLKNPTPPVALLTSHATMAAGELAVVTFQGRPNVRIFGESTDGSPFLVFHTNLSDGAFLGISGAFSVDRTGRMYDGPIEPNTVVITHWSLFGTDHDPVIVAAQNWLLGQPACIHQ